MSLMCADGPPQEPQTMGQCQLEARFYLPGCFCQKGRAESSSTPSSYRPPSLVCRQTCSRCEPQMFGSASGFGNEAPLLECISLSRLLNFTEMRWGFFFFSGAILSVSQRLIMKHCSNPSDDLTLMNA